MTIHVPGMTTGGALIAVDRLAAGQRRGRGIVGIVGGSIGSGAVVVGLIVALAFVWWAGLVAVAVVAAGLWFGFVAPRIAAAERRALVFVGPLRTADPRSDARLLNLVESLAPTAGLARPRCLVADDPVPNALALGRDPRHGCLVVTTGLVERLSRIELEAVVAHGLVRLRDGTTIAPTLGLAFGGPGWLVRRAMAHQDPGMSDLEAVTLTRYPPGLTGALRIVGDDVRAGGARPAQASPVLDPLWLVVPGDAGALVVRAGALQEL